MAAPAVGIDLGTTNSVVAVSVNGKPAVITDPMTGASLIPSVVSFTERGERLVGRAARARRAFDPANTVSSVKRLLGRPFKSEEVRRARSRVAFELTEGPDSAVMVNTRAGSFSLPELSALVLREVRRVAEQFLAQKVERCVVTVPANFNELQRSSTKIAGKIAELDVVRILNEPTAAALAYGYGRGSREKICIYDFGGGTFDVTLLELNGNVFEVLSTWGDTFLGGDDVDMAITDAIAPLLARATGIDVARDRLAYDILRDSVEVAKCALSSRDAAVVDFNYAPPGAAGPVRFTHSLTRPELDRLASPFVEKTFSVCQEAFKLAAVRPSDLTAVILVGGSTRLPTLRAKVAQFFGRDPLTHLPPEEVVGLGASILAEALTPGARNRKPTLPPTPAASLAPPVAPTASVAPAAPPPVPAPAPASSFVPPPPAPGQASSSPLRGATLVGQPGAAGTRLPPPVPPPVPGGSQRPSQLPPPPPAQAFRPPLPPAPLVTSKPTPVPPLDLDDPFASPSAGARTVAAPVSHKPTPLPGSLPGLTDLDEPSFLGKMAPAIATAAMFGTHAADRSKEPSVPAFDLDDTSVAGFVPPRPDPLVDLPATPAELPNPFAAGLPDVAPELPSAPAELPAVQPDLPVVSAPPVKPPLGAPPRPSSPAVLPVSDASALSGALASLPPALAAAIRPPPPREAPPPAIVEEPTTTQPAVTDASVPSFRLDASLFGDPSPAPSSPSPDASVPSFRLDADDIFGAPAEAGSGTLVAKSPFESSLPSFDQPTTTQAPPEVKPVTEEPTLRGPAPSPSVRSRVAYQDDLATPSSPPTAPAVQPADDGLAPLVVPAPVKTNPDALRATARASQPPTGATLGRIAVVPVAHVVPSTPPITETIKPSLPPGRAPASSPPAAQSQAPASVSAPPPGQGTPSMRASMPGSNISMPLLLDVTPLSLGVETAGGQCEAVIRRNSTIPVEQTRVFATTSDNQTSVIIRIAQGESRKFSENQTLGELELTGLRGAPRGEVSVAVTFELSADGTLSVRAKDVETGREQATRVSLLTLPTEAAQADMAARQRAAQTATA